MSDLLRALVCLIAVLSFQGCGPPVTFEHPVIDPALSVPAPEFYGIYPINDDSSDGDRFLLIAPAHEPQAPGMFRITGILAEATTGRVEVSHESTLGFASPSGSHWLVHFPRKQPPDSEVEETDNRYFQSNWSAENTVGYDIFAWRMRPDQQGFVWSFVNPERVIEEIENGHLRGIVEYDTPQAKESRDAQAVRVTASSAELKRYFEFVERHNLEDLFGGDGFELIRWPHPRRR